MSSERAVWLPLFLAMRFWVCYCLPLGFNLPTCKVGQCPCLPDGHGG